MRKFAVLGILMMLAGPVFAYDDGRSSDGSYTAASKLGRGLAEVTTGFLELPGNVYAMSRDDGAGTGMTIGFAKGIGMIPVRELVGVYDIVSSPFSPPGHFDPVIEPAYPWSYFEGAPDARTSAAMRGETRTVRRSTDHSTSGAYR